MTLEVVVVLLYPWRDSCFALFTSIKSKVGWWMDVFIEDIGSFVAFPRIFHNLFEIVEVKKSRAWQIERQESARTNNKDQLVRTYNLGSKAELHKFEMTMLFIAHKFSNMHSNEP
ncbi:uncharacterized protein LAJ45_05649 [Morchella importuna]|uniref:uncharacterized protein n=1 Tax=Morchella importuna TaxID=1174673 RepID=UPI001E8DF640|nr:uncharacterized protein LAJ45_05649 [Morchella importuna]KAH8150436.1 hypothetical protein LAJ45_05649 [Morchella importuna]